MAPEDKGFENVILTRIIRLDAVIHGIVFGLIAGIILFIATLWLVIKGGPVVGPNLALLGQFFIGYRVTVLGSFIGFGYGFLSGFLGGYFIATIYNWIVDLREKRAHQ
jgi:hypothetical protein